MIKTKSFETKTRTVLCALCVCFFRQIVCLKTNKCRLLIAVGRCSKPRGRKRRSKRNRRKMKMSCGIFSIVDYIAYRPLPMSRTAQIGHIIYSRAQNIFFFLFKKPISVWWISNQFVDQLLRCVNVTKWMRWFQKLYRLYLKHIIIVGMRKLKQSEELWFKYWKIGAQRSQWLSSRHVELKLSRGLRWCSYYKLTIVFINPSDSLIKFYQIHSATLIFKNIWNWTFY